MNVNANKPHVRFIEGRWQVFRHISACPWQLPTVIRDSLAGALESHFKYVNGR